MTRVQNISKIIGPPMGRFIPKHWFIGIRL
jgi:hypothetical protein